MYQKKYRNHMIKSGLTILGLLLIAICSTYLIYQKFSKQSEKDYDIGEMEVVYHTKRENKVTLKQYIPVSDAVGLTTSPYSFTIYNNTRQNRNYKIILKEDSNAIEECGCSEKKIPIELLKLSFRKDHTAPVALVLSEYENGILYEGTLNAGEKEDYSIRIFAMDSNFIVDKRSHYHGIIEVVEE